MIVNIYQDVGTDLKSPHFGKPNLAQEYWAELSTGHRRPATPGEVELWQELEAKKHDHQQACELAWELYSAAMGVTIHSFDGVPEGGPVEAVKAERNRLLRQDPSI